MKKPTIVLCLCLLSNYGFCQVIISGEIKNAPDSSEVDITYFNNTIENVKISAGKTRLDKQGKFALNFNLDKPTIATLTIGKEQTDLFLLPDDHLTTTVDYSKFDETIIYKGKGAADNNYMAADLLAGFNIKANYYSAYNDADKYKLYEDNVEKENNEFLKAHETPEFTTEFRTYIYATTKYRFINSRWMFTVLYDKLNKKISTRELPESYFDFLKTLDLNDQNANENINYSVALMRYLYENNDSKSLKNIPDSLPAIQKKEMQVTKDYNYRKSIFKGKVLDYQLTIYVKKNIGLLSADTKFTEELIKDYKTVCKNPEYISIIDKTFKVANKLVQGNVAPEFTLVNEEGNQVSLSSFKGKVIYIDFWATHCVPCLAAMPDSRKLMEKFKDRNDIVFLYINVSDEKEKWKNYLTKEKQGGINLYADREQSAKLLSAYNFSGIPHYVMIDRNGKLINPNAESPGKAEKTIFESAK